jgi:hypothetical protein
MEEVLALLPAGHVERRRVQGRDLLFGSAAELPRLFPVTTQPGRPRQCGSAERAKAE